MKKVLLFILAFILLHPSNVYAQDSLGINLRVIKDKISIETGKVDSFKDDNYERIEYIRNIDNTVEIYVFQKEAEPHAILVKGTTKSDSTRKELSNTSAEIKSLISTTNYKILSHESDESNDKYYSFIAGESDTFSNLYYTAIHVNEFIDEKKSKFKTDALELLENKDFIGLNQWIHDNSITFSAEEDFIEIETLLNAFEPYWDNFTFEYDPIEDKTIISYKELKEVNETINFYSQVEYYHTTRDINLNAYHGLITEDWVFPDAIIIKLDGLDPFRLKQSDGHRISDVRTYDDLLEVYEFSSRHDLFNNYQFRELEQPPVNGVMRLKGDKEVDITLTEDEITSQFVMAKYDNFLEKLIRFIR